MKIRIYDNSVRLRLDRAEVDRVAADNPVSGTTHFPDGAQFTYALNTHKGEALQACFAQGCIELKVPRSVAQNWANDESEVSIRGSLAKRCCITCRSRTWLNTLMDFLACFDKGSQFW